MIVDERFVTYINSLSGGNTKLLEEIETEALGTDVPVIRKETQECLKLFLAMKKPERILEVGTAVGFSAILMKTYKNAKEYNEQDCRDEFISPLLECFGWDVHNKKGVAPQYKEVVVEKFSGRKERPLL